MAELDGNPQDSGGVGPNRRLKKGRRLRFARLNETISPSQHKKRPIESIVVVSS